MPPLRGPLLVVVGEQLLHRLKAYDCTWSRSSRRKGTVFTTESGERMTFARGQVWVVLVNDGRPVIP